MAISRAVRPDDIRRIRSFYGLSAEGLAREIGTTARSIYRWERGQCVPLPLFNSRLEELARAASIDLGGQPKLFAAD